jgi:hypothetical protein
MTRKFLFAALLCVLATGCDRSAEPTTQSSQETSNAATAPAKNAVVARHGQVVLAGGYVPSFPYKLRSQRHQPDGDKFHHVVVIEFKDAEPQDVVAKLSADLTNAGFSVAAPVEHQGGNRIVATGKSTRLTADIYGTTPTKLVFPDSKGLGYFSWVDRNPQ